MARPRVLGPRHLAGLDALLDRRVLTGLRIRRQRRVRLDDRAAPGRGPLLDRRTSLA